MNHQKSITTLTILIILLSRASATIGIFSGGGPGEYPHESIRGETVTIYGVGIYRHMSAAVAPQGIAQDYITLLAAITRGSSD